MRSNRFTGRLRVSLGMSVISVVMVALGAGTGGALAAGSVSSSQSAALKNAVTITRDSAGIPHIVARSFKALGYGEGYTFAADNLCTFANDIITVEGQRSRYFGPTALAVNYSAGTSSTNLQSDLYWQYVKASGLVQRELKAAPPNGLLPQVRSIYSGFVAGYNHYLRSGQLRDQTCKGKPWAHTISLTDMILRGAQIVTEGSAQQFLSGIVSAAPPAVQAASRARRAAPSGHLDLAALRAQFGDQADRSQGSNGIGLGAQGTRSGHGLVLANPHFPWRGTERFWMAQLDVPGQYNVEGGTLMGFPLIGIGFNRHLAWTHTVSTSRRFVAYQLNLVPGDPTSYYLDGQVTKMGRVTVTLRFGSSTVSHTFYTTHWGVVVTVAAAHYGWDTSHAYALYDAVGAAGPRAANQYFRMGQATAVRSLYNVEAKYLAIPTFNTISADDHGNAYYGDVGATPAVSQTEINSCTPPGIPQLVYAAARVITLDGSKTSCAPANYAGTPATGLFPARLEPHIFRRDYVENSNDSYWLANPAHPLTGFSPIIGLTGVVQGLRTRLGLEMIAQRLKGTDGLGAPKFTISTLQRMWEGDRSESAELVASDLAADCRAHPVQTASDGQTVDLTAACHAVGAYDKTGTLGAKGGWLFEVWAQSDSDANFYAVPFNPAAPLTTPNTLNPGTPTAPATPLKWLADAVLNLKANGLSVDASYAQVQHAPQSRSIPIAGCDTGCFNAIYASIGPTTNPVNVAPYGQVYDGSSLVMTTALNPSGPTSEGILTYSESTDPTSRWYTNMTKLYSRRRWAKLAYTPAQLQNESHLPPQVLIAR